MAVGSKVWSPSADSSVRGVKHQQSISLNCTFSARLDCSHYLISSFGAILELLRQFFDLLRLLENGERKNFGGVNLIELEFEVAHFGEQQVHRFSKFLFLCLQLGALRAFGVVGGFLSVLLLGRLRWVDRRPAPRCRNGRLCLEEQERTGDAGEISKEVAAGLEHIHLRGRTFRAALGVLREWYHFGCRKFTSM